MPPPFHERQKGIIKQYITPFLKEKGFKKLGAVYNRGLEEVVWVINIQKNRWNSQEKAEFTMNVGVHIPGIISTYINKPEPKRPTILDCCIEARLGLLSTVGRDRWWELTHDDIASKKDREIGMDIQDRLNNDAFPFFDRFRNTKNVADYLEAERSREERHIWPQNVVIGFTYASILALRQGKHEHAKGLMIKARDLSKKKPNAEDIQELCCQLFGSEL